MNQIFYPTIDLFTYQLRSALNFNTAEIKQQKQDLLNLFPSEIRANIKEPEVETEYQELYTNPDSLQHDFDLIPKNKKLEGYIYPVVLNDVYGIKIDCSVDNLKEPQPINSCAEIKTEIEAIAQPSSLTIGQTWLISGWLKEGDLANAEAIAQDCYQSTFDRNLDDWQEYFHAESDFLTGKLFELWQPHSSSSSHIVILLLPNRKMAEQAAKYNKYWMGLFCYRHKITWAYNQSRLIKQVLIRHFRQVEENTQTIKQNRYGDKNLSNTENQLSNIQNSLDQYSRDLFNLSFQKQIIDINFVNYQKIVKFIQKKAGTELNYLNQFKDLVESKYLTQIDKDTANMQLGIRLLENNLQAMNSRIQLKKEKRDRNFQELVAIIGTGIAGASVAKPEEIQCDIFTGSFSSICQTPVIGRLALALLFIVIFGFLGWLVRYIIRKIQ